MADPIVLGTIDTNDFVNIDRIDDLIAQFGPGDRGQITLPLDPEIAVDEGYTQFVSGTSQLNAVLRSEGLRPWPGRRQIAILDWPNRNVHIRFTNPRGEGIPAVPHYASQQAYQSLTTEAERRRWMYENIAQSADEDFPDAYPRAVILTGILARLIGSAGLRASSAAGFKQIAAQTGRRLATAGASFSSRAGALKVARASFKTSIRALRVTGRAAFAIPLLAALVVGGAIIFFALNPDKLIEVLKWVGEKAVEGATAIGRKAAEALGLEDKMGMLVLAGGLLAGGFLFMRRKR